MQASDLLHTLESNEIEVLDNQTVSNSMIGGIKSSGVFGAMGSNVINTLFAESMPQPSEDALNAVTMNSPLPDFSPPSDDTPGLG